MKLHEDCQRWLKWSSVNVTVGLAYAIDGHKYPPCIVFKGKGLTKEDKELVKRKDINVTYSSNG